MDPRTGRPGRGILSVAVLTDSATDGDALDNVLFVLGLDQSRVPLSRVPGAEALVLLPKHGRGYRLVTLESSGALDGPGR